MIVWRKSSRKGVGYDAGNRSHIARTIREIAADPAELRAALASGDAKRNERRLSTHKRRARAGVGSLAHALAKSTAVTAGLRPVLSSTDYQGGVPSERLARVLLGSSDVVPDLLRSLSDALQPEVRRLRILCTQASPLGYHAVGLAIRT